MMAEQTAISFTRNELEELIEAVFWSMKHGENASPGLESAFRKLMDDLLERAQRNEPLEKLKPNVYLDDNP